MLRVQQALGHQLYAQAGRAHELMSVDAVRAGRDDVGHVVVDEEDIACVDVVGLEQVVEDVPLRLDHPDPSGHDDTVEERQPIVLGLSVREHLRRPIA